MLDIKVMVNSVNIVRVMIKVKLFLFVLVVFEVKGVVEL